MTRRTHLRSIEGGKGKKEEGSPSRQTSEPPSAPEHSAVNGNAAHSLSPVEESQSFPVPVYYDFIPLVQYPVGKDGQLSAFDIIQQSKELNQGQKALVKELIRFAGRNGECWPGEEKLALKCGCDVRTIRRNKKILFEKGMLRWEKENKKHRSCQYYFPFHPIWQVEEWKEPRGIEIPERLWEAFQTVAHQKACGNSERERVELSKLKAIQAAGKLDLERLSRDYKDVLNLKSEQYNEILEQEIAGYARGEKVSEMEGKVIKQKGDARILKGIVIPKRYILNYFRWKLMFT